MRTTVLILLVMLLSRGFAEEKKPATPSFTPEQLAFYEKEVRPILAENCFKCHSGKKLRGGFSLETHAGVMKGGDLGPAIIPGKLDASPLVRAVRYSEGLEMPPTGKLPAEQIAILVKWAEMGAPISPGREEKTQPETGKLVVTAKDREWWAYRPIKRPVVPLAEGSSPLDRFVRAKLAASGLSPNPPAARLALMRRATFDLTGLPPTPEQVDSFINDSRPDAYERMVDQLLASPAYGERWGRHWLDLVRYAESHGYERDSAKPFAWRYRDYVIDAFNSNKSYDRFLLEQLAGDQLGTTEGLIATGFYRLGIWDDEPADRLLARYDILDGIVSTTGSVFMGTSIGCARCHDHKKDPIPQKDYYRLLAVFRDVTDMNRENLRKVASTEDRKRHEDMVVVRQKESAQLFARAYALEQKFIAASGAPVGDIEGLTYRYYRDAWHEIPDFDAITPLASGPVASGRFGLSPASQTDGIGLVLEGKLKVPSAGEYTFEIDSSDGARLIVNGKRIINRSAKGRAKATGKATLTAGLVSVRLEYFNTVTAPVLQVYWSGPGVERRALSDIQTSSVLVPHSRDNGVIWSWTTTKPAGGWQRPGFDDTRWKTGPGGFGQRGTPGSVVRTPWLTPNIWLRKTFTLEKVPSELNLDVHHDEDVTVYLNGTEVYHARGYLRDYERVKLPSAAVAALKPGENVIAVHCKQTSGGQYVDVGLAGNGETDLASMLAKDGEKVLGAETYAELKTLRSELARLVKVPTPEAGLDVMCVTESGKAVTNVLIRGNPHAVGESVTPGAPEVLGSKQFEGSKRRQLAEWLTEPSNPLTARVMANRLWQYHFGRGLAGSTNDFGKLGETPTHPELLDWLAMELIESDWDLKHMHRVMMTSDTYRQSSAGRAEALAKDGGNNLLWRYSMRRLHAEEVRDAVLSASGELNRRMSGPPIYPPIPAAVLAGQSVPGAGWGKSPPQEAARRSVYVHVKRSLLLPILQTHDSADTDSSCPVRYTTTVPTQALGMLNGEFTNDQAAKLAARLQIEAASLPEQIRRVIRLTTGRVPGADELKADIAFVERLLKEEGVSMDRALTMYCLLVLNANEFVYVD